MVRGRGGGGPVAGGCDRRAAASDRSQADLAACLGELLEMNRRVFVEGWRPSRGPRSGCRVCWGEQNGLCHLLWGIKRRARQGDELANNEEMYIEGLAAKTHHRGVLRGDGMDMCRPTRDDIHGK